MWAGVIQNEFSYPWANPLNWLEWRTNIFSTLYPTYSCHSPLSHWESFYKALVCVGYAKRHECLTDWLGSYRWNEGYHVFNHDIISYQYCFKLLFCHLFECWLYRGSISWCFYYHGSTFSIYFFYFYLYRCKEILAWVHHASVLPLGWIFETR